MKGNELQFDRSCHVLYSKPCRREIQQKIALHYPEAEREAVWERVQRQYVDFISDWRTDLGGRKNFHNGAGGNYDCVTLMAYYVVCKEVTSLAEIEEMGGICSCRPSAFSLSLWTATSRCSESLCTSPSGTPKNIECVLMATGVAEHIHSAQSAQGAFG